MSGISPDPMERWRKYQKEAYLALDGEVLPVSWKVRLWLIWMGLTVRARSWYFRTVEVRVDGWETLKDGKLYVTRIRRR